MEIQNIPYQTIKNQTNHLILKYVPKNHYYPFGLKHEVYADGKQKYQLVENMPGMENVARPSYVYKTDYQYKYNGKEFQDELGLNWYDYHARNYDPALGRWNVIDPMAPKYFSHSPYAYTLNNPVYFIDPTGMMVETGDPPIGPINEDPIVLETAVIKGKAPEKRASSSAPTTYYAGFNLNFGGSFDAKKAFFGNHVDGAYNNIFSNAERTRQYGVISQARAEGQLGVVVLFGSVVALPYTVTWGTVGYAAIESSAFVSSAQTAIATVIQKQGLEVSLRFAADVGAQAAFNNGEVNYFSAAAGAMTPWYLSGAASEATQLTQNSLETGRLPDSQAVTSSLLKSTMVAPMGSVVGGIMRNQGAGAVATEVTEAVINEMGSRTMDNKVQQHIK